MPHYILHSRRFGYITIRTENCPDCRLTETLDIPEEEYRAYLKNEVAIQDALPSLTPAQRERLQTGYCGNCYDELCKELER